MTDRLSCVYIVKLFPESLFSLSLGVVVGIGVHWWLLLLLLFVLVNRTAFIDCVHWVVMMMIIIITNDSRSMSPPPIIIVHHNTEPGLPTVAITNHRPSGKVSSSCQRFFLLCVDFYFFFLTISIGCSNVRHQVHNPRLSLSLCARARSSFISCRCCPSVSVAPDPVVGNINCTVWQHHGGSTVIIWCFRIWKCDY